MKPEAHPIALAWVGSSLKHLEDKVETREEFNRIALGELNNVF